MSVVLFYTPFIRRSPDVESLMMAFRSRGHKVIFLTQDTGEHICPFLKENGIETHSYYIGRNKNLWYYLKHFVYFIYFCWKRKVDFVFSHLDPANFVAAIGQYFIKGNTYLGRHHINEAALYEYHASLSYRITNFMARKIIVVSRQAREYMINVEKVNPHKVIHINLAYDFSLFRYPHDDQVYEIKQRAGGDVLLLTVCRLATFKRPQMSIHVLRKIRSLGINAKLFILGAGEMESELREMIASQGLDKDVFLMGHVFNVLDYMGASDFILHPSILESSCVTIKEAGLMEKPVIVCKGVGDFDDYLKTGVNGFAVDKENFVQEATEIVKHCFENRGSLKVLGRKLHEDVKEKFDIHHLIGQYDFVK